MEPRYMLGEVLPRAQEFKYMRLNSTGRRWSRKSDKKDVNDWSSWKNITRVFCDKKLPAKVKEKCSNQL